MKSNINRLLTIQTVADRLGISPATTYRLIHAGKLKALKVGLSKGFRVRMGDLEEFEKSREICSW